MMYHAQNAHKIVVIYGHEMSTMLEEILSDLGVFERRVLRMIVGGVQVCGGLG